MGKSLYNLSIEIGKKVEEFLGCAENYEQLLEFTNILQEKVSYKSGIAAKMLKAKEKNECRQEEFGKYKKSFAKMEKKREYTDEELMDISTKVFQCMLNIAKGKTCSGMKPLDIEEDKKEKLKEVDLPSRNELLRDFNPMNITE